jgi:hypothetical protein
MAITEALQILASYYWDSIWASLDQGNRDRITSAISDLVLAGSAGEALDNPDQEALDEAAQRLLNVLRDVLPADHSVLDVANETYRYSTVLSADWQATIDALSARLAAIVSDSVRDRLSRAPALTPEQVRSAGSDPDAPFLIRLDTDDEGRLPAFQFGQDGLPIETVLRINERLGAHDDPWGAADWWLADNAWLDVIPAELIGRRDDLLLAAADAATRPDWW